MKINITKKEYETLLKSLLISDWVLHAFSIGEREDTTEFKALQQKIFSFAKDFGMNEYVIYDRDLKSFYHTRKFEDESQFMTYIEDYDDQVFWDELGHRLSIRDISEEYEEEQLSNMDRMERFSKIEDYFEQYSTEFETNGLRRFILNIKKS